MANPLQNVLSWVAKNFRKDASKRGQLPSARQRRFRGPAPAARARKHRLAAHHRIAQPGAAAEKHSERSNSGADQ